MRSCLSEAKAQALVPQWVLRPFWAHERSKPGARYARRCFSESCLSESCLSEATSVITIRKSVARLPPEEPDKRRGPCPWGCQQLNYYLFEVGKSNTRRPLSVFCFPTRHCNWSEKLFHWISNKSSKLNIFDEIMHLPALPDRFSVLILHLAILSLNQTNFPWKFKQALTSDLLRIFVWQDIFGPIYIGIHE